MKPTYAAGMVAYLLERCADPRIVKVETFAQVGAVGHHWPPCGLKVTLADGSAVFLSTNATAAPGEDRDAQPDEFRPEDLGVRHVSGVRG